MEHHKFDGNFDDSICVKPTQGPGTYRDTCCGKYENRGRRYRYNSDEKMCCGDETYNYFTKECCGSDTSDVRDIGTC